MSLLQPIPTIPVGREARERVLAFIAGPRYNSERMLMVPMHSKSPRVPFWPLTSPLSIEWERMADHPDYVSYD